MNRRQFGGRLAASMLAASVTPRLLAASDPAPNDLVLPQDDMMQTMNRFVDDLAEGDARIKEMIAPSKPRQIAMLAYPGMYPLDLLGPLTIFSDLLNTNVQLVWKSRMAVPAGRGVQANTVSFADVPSDLDVLFVPGGTVGTLAAMRDAEVLDFLRQRAPKSRFVTSVCTGALVLGAAGLLKGRRATTHWLTHDLLTKFGATPVERRVVEDGNVITGAGVTAGLDFAFVVTARLAGERYAQAEQLNVEYDPDPPFHAGSTKRAGPRLTATLRRMYGSARTAFEAAAREAGGKLT